MSDLNKEEQALLLLFKAIYKNPSILMISDDEFTWSETLLEIIQSQFKSRLILFFSKEIPALYFDGTIEISDYTIKKNVQFPDGEKVKKIM